MTAQKVDRWDLILKNILLFVDLGIDDAFTLIYLLKKRNVNLIGVVAGYGNISRNKSYRNVKYILELAGREDIPVISGSTKPLDGSEPEFYPEIHGEEGLGPFRPPVSSDVFQDVSNFSLMFDLIQEYANDVTIVATGRFTALAMAWELNPAIMSNVSKTVIMGGAFLVPGNVTENAEANFHGDPIAANVLAERVPNLTILPLNATLDSYITPEQINQIDEAQKDEVGKLLKPLFEYYYVFYQTTNPQLPRTPIHDLVAAMVALDVPVVTTYEERIVRVSYHDPITYGLSTADFRAVPTQCGEDASCSRIGIVLDRDVYVKELLSVYALPVENREHEPKKGDTPHRDQEQMFRRKRSWI